MQNQRDVKLESGGKRKARSDEGDSPSPKKFRQFLRSPTSFSPGASFNVTSPESCDSRTDETSDLSVSPSSTMMSPKSMINSPNDTLAHRKRKVANKYLLQTSLRTHYKMLKENLNANELADHLLQDDLIDSELHEKIQETRYRRRKVDLIIKGLITTEQQHPKMLIRDRFFRVLRQTGDDHIVTKLQAYQNGCPPYSVGYLQNPKRFLKDMEREIEEDVEPKIFLDDMLVVGGISFNDHEDILNIDERRKRVKTLTRIMIEKPSCYIGCLVNTITEKYPRLHALYLGIDKKRTRECPHQRPITIHSTACENEICGSDSDDKGAGATVKCKFNFTSNGRNLPSSFEQMLRNVEEKLVNRFNRSAATQATLSDKLMEDCLSRFDALHFSSIILQVKTLSEKSLKNIVEACGNGKAADWILQILSDEEIETLRKLNVQKMTVEVTAYFDDNITSHDNVCLCAINKRSITRNFTSLVENMRGSRKTIYEITKTKMLSEKQTKVLANIAKIQDIKQRNEQLLRYLLNTNTPEVFCCILEKELLEHGGRELIEITRSYCQTSVASHRVINNRTIEENMAFLEEELDARSFVRVLGDLNENSVVEKILSTDSRRERTKIFLKFLCKERKITWFEDELRKQNLDYILNVIRPSCDQANVCTGHALAKLLANYSLIVEEIDPDMMQTFVTRNNLPGHDIDAASNSSLLSRKQKASRLVLEIIKKKDEQMAILFFEAMRHAGYEHVNRQLQQGQSPTHKMCPHILNVKTNQSCKRNGGTVFKGSVELKIKATAGTTQTNKSFDEFRFELKSRQRLNNPQPSHKLLIKTIKSDQRVHFDDISESGVSSASVTTEETSTIDGKHGTLHNDASRDEITKNWVDKHFTGTERRDSFLHPPDVSIVNRLVRSPLTIPCQKQLTDCGNCVRTTFGSKPSPTNAKLRSPTKCGNAIEQNSNISSTGYRSYSFKRAKHPLTKEPGNDNVIPTVTQHNIMFAPIKQVKNVFRLLSPTSSLESSTSCSAPSEMSRIQFWFDHTMDSPTDTDSGVDIPSPHSKHTPNTSVTEIFASDQSCE